MAHEGLFIALFVSLPLVVVGGWLTRTFNMYVPNYSAWLFPFLAVWLALPLAKSRRLVRGAQLALILALCLTYGFAGFVLSTRGELFAHTPYKKIAKILDENVPYGLTVVYECDSQHAKIVGYTIAHFYRGKVFNVFCGDGKNGPAYFRDFKIPVDGFPELKGRRVLILRTRDMSSRELAAMAFDTPNEMAARHVFPRRTEFVGRTDEFLRAAGWTQVSTGDLFSFLGVQFSLLAR